MKHYFLQPVLKAHQTRNMPAYIQKKAREKLEQEGKFKLEDIKGPDEEEPPDAKRMRPSSSRIEPLDRSVSSTTPLPELPPDLQQKQDYMDTTPIDNKLLAPPPPPQKGEPLKSDIHADKASIPRCQIKPRKWKTHIVFFL